MHHDDQVLLGEHQWNSATDTTVMIRRNVAQVGVEGWWVLMEWVLRGGLVRTKGTLCVVEGYF